MCHGGSFIRRRNGHYKEIDQNNRLIKGQVFLWEGAKGWEDLWDVDGTITKIINISSNDVDVDIKTDTNCFPS